MRENSPKSGVTREGVIVVALGTPTEASTRAIAEFLGEFLSDKRVVDLPDFLWQPVLRGPILKRRPGKVLEQYEDIWADGSPLRVITEGQVARLAELLPDCEVRVGYQYGNPSFVETFAEMASRLDEITVLPTYPQFAPATVGSVADRLDAALKISRERFGRVPRVRAARSWPELPGYVDWHVTRIANALEEGDADMLVFSWHGLPDRRPHQPARYAAECEATARAIAARLADLGVNVPWRSTFQSKFGPDRWLRPATIDTMARLPREGVRHVIVANPGFMADCLETIYEMDVLNADAFYKAGGQTFRRIGCPDADAGAAILAELRGALRPFE